MGFCLQTGVPICWSAHYNLDNSGFDCIFAPIQRALINMLWILIKNFTYLNEVWASNINGGVTK